MSRLRVLMATPQFLPDMGGVENHVAQVSRRLVEKGVDVTVFTTDGFGHYPAQETMHGAAIRRFPAGPAGKDWYFSPAMARAIGKGDWDVVHVQSYHTLFAPLAMFASFRHGIPYVLTFHGGGSSSALRRRLRPFQWGVLRPLIRRAYRLVALARFEVELYGTAFGVPADRFVYIPNGFDLAPADAVDATRPDPDLIVSVGRLVEYKGHQRVIAALPHLLAERPAMRLEVLGVGPYEAELGALAESLGVRERVRFDSVPPEERTEMARRLRRAALVVLMSEYETHPLAALEAISVGCSVLVADSTGLAETAEGGRAATVALDALPEELAKAMACQLREPIVPSGFVPFTWDDCTDRLLDLYRETARSRR